MVDRPEQSFKRIYRIGAERFAGRDHVAATAPGAVKRRPTVLGEFEEFRAIRLLGRWLLDDGGGPFEFVVCNKIDIYLIKHDRFLCK